MLKHSDLAKLLNMKEVLKAVENAFKEDGLKRTNMPPKVYLDLGTGDFRAMPAKVGKYAGIKWVSTNPQNPQKGLLNVMALIILNDPETSLPLCLMDGTLITSMRTGAAGAIATKYLKKDACKTIGILGCGVQAQMQIYAHLQICKPHEILLYDINRDKILQTIENWKKKVTIREATIEEVCNCDVICTTTPSTSPVVKSEWIKKGTHINAIGADAPGKQELDPRLLKKAKIIVDNVEQASHSGEINVPLKKGIIKKENIIATLGEIIAGVTNFKREKDDITIFDSTGLAIQDIAVAGYVYEKAKKLKVGRLFDLALTENRVNYVDKILSKYK